MPPSKVYSVLLLEDETPTRNYLASLIDMHPQLSLFHAAADCAEARKALAGGTPDILVTDLGLPDGSGIDIIREARYQHHVPEAMVISIFGDEAHVVQAMEAGATGYLLKEQAFDELGDAILSLMAGESAISPKVARFLLRRFSPPEETKPAQTTTAQIQAIDHGLTHREYEVLTHISRGYSYQEIAHILGLSTNTIRAHIRNMYRKLEVSSRSEAVYEASQLGLLHLKDN